MLKICILANNDTDDDDDVILFIDDDDKMTFNYNNDWDEITKNYNGDDINNGCVSTMKCKQFSYSNNNKICIVKYHQNDITKIKIFKPIGDVIDD